jgi:hypothetical protein
MKKTELTEAIETQRLCTPNTPAQEFTPMLHKNTSSAVSGVDKKTTNQTGFTGWSGFFCLS